MYCAVMNEKKKMNHPLFQRKQTRASQALSKMKWIKALITDLSKANPKPLGRWSQCGEKKTVYDVLEFKTRQKARRLYLLETNTDPYHAFSVQHSLLCEKPVHSEEYMRPFVTQS